MDSGKSREKINSHIISQPFFIRTIIGSVIADVREIILTLEKTAGFSLILFGQTQTEILYNDG